VCCLGRLEVENQYDLALAHLKALFQSLLNEEFGEIVITVALAPERKRTVIIRAGKSEKFTVPESDLP
jgi:hypothetical protein